MPMNSPEIVNVPRNGGRETEMFGDGHGRGTETVVRGSCCQSRCNDEAGSRCRSRLLRQMQRLQGELCKMPSSLEQGRHGS